MAEPQFKAGDLVEFEIRKDQWATGVICRVFDIGEKCVYHVREGDERKSPAALTYYSKAGEVRPRT